MPISTHLRLRTGVIALGAAAAFTGVACQPQPGRPPIPTMPHGPTTVRVTTSQTTLPGPAGPGTTAPVPTGVADCGTVYYAAGWPTTFYMRPSPCITDAFAKGTPARLTTREQTDGHGGHILVKTYEVVGVGEFLYTVDATGAMPSGPVTTEHCSLLTSDGQFLHAGGCTPT